MAINDPEYKEEYATWQQAIDKIGNKADAEAKGYFWYVKEAKLIEISAVLEGSNELTPTVSNNKFTPIEEPGISTPKKEPMINYQYLTNSFKK
jgi:hypothetical protein